MWLYSTSSWCRPWYSQILLPPLMPPEEDTPPTPPRLPPGEPSRDPVLETAQGPLHLGGQDLRLFPEKKQRLHDRLKEYPRYFQVLFLPDQDPKHLNPTIRCLCCLGCNARDKYHNGGEWEIDYCPVAWEYNIRDVVALPREPFTRLSSPSEGFSGFRISRLQPGAETLIDIKYQVWPFGHTGTLLWCTVPLLWFQGDSTLENGGVYCYG